MLEYLSQFAIGHALLGGALIGSAAVLLLWTLGKIAGISGISFSLLSRQTPDKTWRLLFVFGLIAGTYLAHLVFNLPVPEAPSASLPLIIIAGLLTGFGTRLGSGCTSGHGVCGIARFSTRSIIATITFMAAGFVTVYLGRHLLGAL